MTQQIQNLPPTETAAPVRGVEMSSRVARLLFAWRTRRNAASQTETDDTVEEPPVEWALRLMM